MVEREILPKSGRIRGIELKADDLCRVIVRDGKPVGLMVNGVEKLFEEDGPQHLDIMAELMTDRTKTGKPRLLDLFCCAGGAGMGYHLAGFEVVGVDINPQPRYPFTFHQADALMLPRFWLAAFDFIHASPPCQAYSPLGALSPWKDYPDLLAATRAMLDQSGVPYVIENVMTAPLHRERSIVLCGSMFGLRTYRHRRFESHLSLAAPEHPKHTVLTATKQRKARWANGWNVSITGDVGTYVGPEAMGIDWMNGNELCEAIPPAYTQHIGVQLLAHLNARIETLEGLLWRAIDDASIDPDTWYAEARSALKQRRPSMTTDTGRLLELANLCEQATGPDRELDAAIAVAALGFYIAKPRWVGSPIAYGYIDKDGSRVEPGYGGKQLIRALTASLDAAMSLVPEGWRAGFEENASCDEPGKSYAWVWPFESNYDPDWQLGQEGQQSNPDAQKGYAATPALALCAASLRARAASATGEGL